MGFLGKLLGKKEKESLDQGLQKTKEGFYFGPFASAGSANWTIKMLQKIFLLRICIFWNPISIWFTRVSSSDSIDLSL